MTVRSSNQAASLRRLIRACDIGQPLAESSILHTKIYNYSYTGGIVRGVVDGCAAAIFLRSSKLWYPGAEPWK